MNKKIVTALVMAAVSSSSAFAGGGLFDDEEDSMGAMYGGASIGKATDADCTATQNAVDNVNEIAGATVVDSVDCSDSNAWKIYGGYKIAPNLALEGAYVDFGKTKADGTIPAISGVNNVANPASIESSGTALNVSGVASTEIADNINAFGKMGIASWTRKSTVAVENVGTSGATLSQEIKDDGVDLSLGAGAEYKVDDNWGIRGEYEHFNGLNANMYSVGAVFSSL